MNGLCSTTAPFPLPLSSTFPQSRYALEVSAGLFFAHYEFRDRSVGPSRDGGVFARVGMGASFFRVLHSYPWPRKGGGYLRGGRQSENGELWNNTLSRRVVEPEFS